MAIPSPIINAGNVCPTPSPLGRAPPPVVVELLAAVLHMSETLQAAVLEHGVLYGILFVLAF